MLFYLFGLRFRCVVVDVCCLLAWWFVAFVDGCFLVVDCSLGLYLCGGLFVLRGTSVRVCFLVLWFVLCVMVCAGVWWVGLFVILWFGLIVAVGFMVWWLTYCWL